MQVEASELWLLILRSALLVGIPETPKPTTMVQLQPPKPKPHTMTWPDAIPSF